MEQWAATLIAAVMALVGVGVGAWLTQTLQARNRQNQFVQEGVLARYAEFVGIASAEEQRAETITILAPHVHDQASREHLLQLDSQRHQHRRDLQRLAWQIQLLERNQELRELLQRLVDEMAFEVIVFGGRLGDVGFSEGLERFRQTWQTYERMLTRLVNLVQVVHLNVRLAQPAPGPHNPTPTA